MNLHTYACSASQDWASQLDAIFARCEGAYSDLTLSGYRKDLEIFAAWCERNNSRFLPAAPRTVADFFDDQLRTCSYATIRRRASAIRFAHVLSDFSSPIQHSDVFLSMRRAARVKGRRPKQSLGLTQNILHKMLAACPDTLAGMRDAAQLCVGYDTLCRSSELAWMRFGDVRSDYSRLYIPRAKNDPFGDGRICFIKPHTRERLSRWIDGSQISSGPLFRGLHTGSVSHAQLDTSSIRRIIKNSARRAGLHEEASRLSGHSMRVGAAQDLLREGADTISIMIAGGWKSSTVVARYVEGVVLDTSSKTLNPRRKIHE